MSRYSVIRNPNQTENKNSNRYSIIRSKDADSKSEAYKQGYEIGLKQAEDSRRALGGVGSFLSGSGTGIGQGATFGWGDEFGAGVNALVRAPFTDKTIKEEYRDSLDFNRGREDAIKSQNPVAAGLGEAVGSVATGMSVLPNPVNLLPRLGVGVGAGGVYGAGVSDSNDAKGVARDALPYAAAGGAIPALQGVGKGIAGIGDWGIGTTKNVLKSVPVVKDIYGKAQSGLDRLIHSPSINRGQQFLNKKLADPTLPPKEIKRLQRQQQMLSSPDLGDLSIGDKLLGFGAATYVNPYIGGAYAAGKGLDKLGGVANRIPQSVQSPLMIQLLNNNLLGANQAQAATTQDDIFHKQSRSPNQYLPRKDPNEELFDRNPIPVDDVPEFKIFDLNNDGVIDGDEYRKFKDQRKKPAPPSSPPPERWDDNDDPSQPPPGHKLGRLPSNTLGPLNTNEIRVYLNTLGERESSNDYGAVNKFGYLGRYQMGLAALEDAGLIKEGTFKQARERGINPNKMLNDPEVWTVKGGKSTFLKDNTLQDRAMFKYTERNLNGLKRAGVIDSDTAKDEVAGYLATAHLKGVGGAKNLAKGIVTKDGFGTATDEYFNLAKNAFRKDS